MSDHVGVRPAEIVAHAATVAAAGDRVEQAAQAGRAVRPGPEAYGRLCVMVPAVLGALQERLVDGIASAAGSLQDTAIRLRATAEGYEETDRRRAQAFDRIRGGR